MRNYAVGIPAFAFYVGCVFAANWAGERWGIVPIGFGLHAPAGLYFVGLAFGARDLVQETLGRRWAIGGILIGGAASYLVAPSFATASLVAFLFSESVDMAIYTPLRDRQWTAAVIASNAVAAVVDSILFLWIAFGWEQVGETWIDLTVGKLYMIAPAVVAIGIWRNRLDLSERLRISRGPRAA